MEKKHYICNNGIGGCWMLCSMEVTIDPEKKTILSIRGNENDPASQGYRCTERITAENLNRLLHHPGQLKYPLERVGKRGEGKWRRLGWDEALDKIAAKLKELVAKHGPETLAVAEGTYRMDTYWARSRFLNILGNPNNVGGAGVMCFCNDATLQYATLGGNLKFPPKTDNINTYVIQGSSGRESMPLIWNNLQAKMEEDKKLGKPKMKFICLDPRATTTAAESDVWLRLRPGTDGAMYMGWLNVILTEKLHDAAFVEQWTNAPFLVKESGRQLLRENDVTKGGSSERFVVWDAKANRLAVWDPELYEYAGGGAVPALSGTRDVKLADGRSVRCRTVWDLLCERVAPYTPERVSEISWVPPDRIREAARLYATNKPSVFQWFVGTDQLGLNATRIEQIRILLRAVTGQLDVAEYITRDLDLAGFDGAIPGRGQDLQMEEMLSPEQRKKQLGADRFRLLTWPSWEIIDKYYRKKYGKPFAAVGHNYQVSGPLIHKAILSKKPYPVTAFLVTHHNCLVADPNTKEVYQALTSENLELLVVADHWMTPTAELADIVLPIASKLEKPFVDTFEDFFPDLVVGEQLFEPLHDRHTEWELYKGLAMRMGQEQYWPWKTEHEAQEERLKPLGMTIQEGAKTGWFFPRYVQRAYEEKDPKTGRPTGFITPTGKAELYSVVLEMLDYDPLPDFVEPPESPYSTPEVAKEFPLILITGGRFRPQYHSENRQYGFGMREIHPDPLCDLNDETARTLGIANGDWIWIETRRGRIRQRARTTGAVHPEVIHIQHGWWFPEQAGEAPTLHGVWQSCSNVLTINDPDTFCELGGGWPLRALLCKIYKAEGADIPAPPKELINPAPTGS